MTGALHMNHFERKYKIHPKMFLLYLGIASMIMFFSAFSSALIVKRGDIKNWQDVFLPSMFIYSTVVILISSFTIQMALKYIHTSSKFQFYSWLTLVLAVLFLFLQWMGWNQLKSMNVFYVGNPSGSYIYFISFIHGFHYILGIAALFLLIRAYAKGNMETNSLNFKILTHYWHFIGLVWVYLFILFKFIIYK